MPIDILNARLPKFFFKHFLTSPIFFVFLWLILTYFLIRNANFSFATILFAASTMLIFTHVLYGGYFLYQKENRLNPLVFFITALIYISLILLINDISVTMRWFFGLQITFLCAIFFHYYYKSRLTRICLQEFCNYKLYIEIFGTVFCFLGMLFYTFFPVPVLWGLIILAFIVKFNFTIFRKKRLYSADYEPPNISETPFVSIVIIAYNEEHYIGKLLESIKIQDYKNYEIIIVDDHSLDRTKDVASSFAPVLPLKVVQKDVRGISRSRNYGASFSRGQVILFLDADVILPAGFISQNIKVFIEKRLSIAGVDFVAITENKTDKFITGFYRAWLKIVQYFNPRGIGICLFVDSKLHQSLLFDESIIMSEDFDYVKRAVQHGKFRIISAVPLKVSWRRFKNENRFLLILKYLFFECYRQNIGEIRKKMIPYEFGHSNPEQR